MAGGAGSSLGTGGMATKLQAAQVAMSAGVNMVIASGSEEGVLRRILQGEAVGTVFPARESHLRVRKSWLAFGKRLQGDLVVDAAASRRSRAARACSPRASRSSTAISRRAARCASSRRTTARLRAASSTTSQKTSASSSGTGRRSLSISSRALPTRRSFIGTIWS